MIYGGTAACPSTSRSRYPKVEVVHCEDVEVVLYCLLSRHCAPTSPSSHYSESLLLLLLLLLLEDDDDDEEEEEEDESESESESESASTRRCDMIIFGAFFRCARKSSVRPPRPIDVKKLIAKRVLPIALTEHVSEVRGEGASQIVSRIRMIRNGTSQPKAI